MAALGSPARNSPRKTLLLSVFSKSLMEQRKKGWEELFKKVETNSKDISNFKLDKTLPEYLEGLETKCSQILKEIRKLIFKRNESRLLQDGNFEELEHRLFNVFLEARDVMVQDDVKAHIKTALKRNLPEIKKKINKYRSDLGTKLILRKEQGEKGSRRYATLNLEIRKEWGRLLKVMPLEDLVVYSLDILKTHKLNKIQKKQLWLFGDEELMQSAKRADPTPSVRKNKDDVGNYKEKPLTQSEKRVNQSVSKTDRMLNVSARKRELRSKKKAAQT